MIHPQAACGPCSLVLQASVVSAAAKISGVSSKHHWPTSVLLPLLLIFPSYHTRIGLSDTWVPKGGHRKTKKRGQRRTY